LDQICIKITDGTHHSPKNSANGDFAYITSKNIREFRLDLTDVTDIDKATHDEIYARCDVQLNDVLYVKDGANTGLAAKNTIEGPFSLLSSVGVFRPISFINPDYLVAYLNSRETRDRMLSQIAGVAITRLTLSKLKISAIAVPPLAEQVRIVAEVERRLSVVEKLEAIISANLQRAALLRQSILQKAFSGELAGHDVSCPSSSPNRRDGYDG
jgi:type I restriction enzyme S subunit